jgi:uncharacterized membrane protein YkoI
MIVSSRDLLCMRAALALFTVGLCAADPVLADKDVTTVRVAGAVPRISQEQAIENALKVLPGKVTDVTQERKRGKTVWVIEIVADKDGSENDVLVDMNSGAILAVER